MSLASWQPGAARTAIVEYLERVERVPAEERVAVLDNDGTLWCEQPAYLQALFILERLAEQAAADPQLGERPVVQALLAGDLAAATRDGLGPLLDVLLDTHAGLTTEEFEAAVAAWVHRFRHPRFGVPVSGLVYQPMLELLDLLRAHAFRVFVVTGGGVEFVRSVSDRIYGVARDDVVGSAVEVAVERRDGRMVLVRRPALAGSPNEGAPKVQSIQARIGRRPVVAVGNSAGDREMLEYAHTGDRPSLCLVVDHDDAEREYAYAGAALTDPDAEPITETARARGWTIVSMRRDWARVFPVTAADAMARIPGATFRMGSDDHYPEEAPAHPVRVSGFWIDRTPVTNRQFGSFVAATGYVTVAERPLDPAQFPGAPAENLVPGSLVFTRTAGPVDLRHLAQWWTWTPGASWSRPEGPRSSLRGREDHPVVHVAYEDAERYAAWAGKALPTEAQWELAARGGLDGAEFTWGDEPEPPGARLAHYWHGDFPWRPAPGYGTTAPVAGYPANGYGLFDMAGNVWEWTRDWYAPRHPDAAGERPCCIPRDPAGAARRDSLDPAQPQFPVPRRVIKGGSFLCADSYCRRYRPAARRPQMIDTGMSHIGFRCVRDRAPQAGAPTAAT